MVKSKNDKLWDYLVSLFEDDPGTVVEWESEDSVIIHRTLPAPRRCVDISFVVDESGVNAECKISGPEYYDCDPDTPNTDFPFEDNEGWN
jgi:hypothetical protein